MLVMFAAVGSIALTATTPSIETTPIPKPQKPDFSSMSWFVGTWNCTLKSSRRQSPVSVTEVTTIDPTGYWMISKSSSKATSWSPPSNTTDMMTHDSDPKRWVDILTGDFGTYDASSSPGWTGTTLVWTDLMFRPSSDVMAVKPTTQTKISDTKWAAHSAFQQRSNARWITVDNVCLKSMQRNP